MLASLLESTAVLRPLVAAKEALAKVIFGLTTFALEPTHLLHAFLVQLRGYFGMSTRRLLAVISEVFQEVNFEVAVFTLANLLAHSLGSLNFFQCWLI